MGSTPKPGTYSASQVAALIGLSQYQSPFHAFQNLKEATEPGWNKKHGYQLPPAPDNASIRWGLAFEDAIINLAEDREGVNIGMREAYYQKEINNIALSCHLDGIIVSDPYAIHEGKSTHQWAYTSKKKEIIDRLGHDGQLENGFNIIRRWGDPGTDQTPQEYQVQAAVQRICTGAALVKLSVLVFEKAPQQYEDMGWEVINISTNQHSAGDQYGLKKEGTRTLPYEWARVLAQMGNFQTYLLPSAPDLENAIIEAVTKFDRDHLRPGIPPQATLWDDVRRLLPNPCGTVIATPELVNLCKEYSETVRQLGSASPIRKRQEIIKPRIMDLANALTRTEWTEPPDRLLVLDPDGGEKLAEFHKQADGKLVFRAQRAK